MQMKQRRKTGKKMEQRGEEGYLEWGSVVADVDGGSWWRCYGGDEEEWWL